MAVAGLVWASLGWSMVGSAPGEACEGRAEIQVVDLGTGEALADFEVEIEGAQGSESLRSDAAGRVQLEGRCESQLRAKAGRLDYEPASVQVPVGSEARAVTLGLEPVAVDRIEDAVVIAPAPRTQAAGPGSQLDRSALAQSRGQGLADSLARLPGVTSLRSAAGGMGKPIIRGQLGRRNLVIFDGVRHEAQKWGLEHAPEVDPWAADSITVIKGAATPRWGADAVGGVVLIDPPALPRTPGVRGSVEMVGDSNPLGGGGALRIDGAHEKTKGFAWRVDANAKRSRAAVTPEYPLDNTGAFVWNAGGKLGWLSENFDLELGFRHHAARLGICSCVRVSTVDEFEQAIETGRPVSVEFYEADFEIERARQAVDHELALARTRIELGRAGTLYASYDWQFDARDEFDIVRRSVRGPQLSFELTNHHGEIRFAHAPRGVGHGFAWLGEVGIGGGYQDNDFEANTTLIPDYVQGTGGAFAVERFVSERVEVELGLRAEFVWRQATLIERDFLSLRAGERLVESRCERLPDDGAECTHEFVPVSGSVATRIQPSAAHEELTFALEFDSAARAPAIDEQFMNGAAPSFPLLGQGQARSGIERTWGNALSLRWQDDRLWAEGAAYLNYIDGYIYFAGDPQEGQCDPLTCTARGPMPLFTFSPVDALFGGGELGVVWGPAKIPFEFRGQGAWVRALDLDQRRALSFVPSDRYSLGLRWLWPERGPMHDGFLGLRGDFVARQRRFDLDADFAEPPPGYFLLGAEAGVELDAPASLFRISLVGANLTNQRYREYTSLVRYFADEPGWSLQLRLGVDFGPRAEFGRKKATPTS